MTPELGITLFGDFNLLWLLLALAGGAFGAMIGGNYAFGFTGVTVLLGLGVTAATGSTIILDYVAFGPVFGPHIAFCGGAAAAAYAAKKSLLDSGGKDVSASLAGLNRPDVLMVGALFGGGAYIVQRLVALIPWFGTHTDSVAFTVVVSGVAARILFGSTPVYRRKVELSDSQSWLRYQEKPGQLAVISGFVGLLAAGISIMVVTYAAGANEALAANAHTLPFALSAICIFFVASGHRFPVSHHMSINAGFAAVQFLSVTGNALAAVLIGTVVGIIGGFVGELAARRMQDHGDTHIDPPGASIWFTNTLVHLALIPF